MTLRTTAIILGLAVLAGGCTVNTYHDDVGDYQYDRVIHEDDAYEGYYYVRIVYLNGVPWYVDDDLRARPVPGHLRSRFRYSSWTRSLPPSFGRDSGERDGYRLSRIVYINGIPHNVDADRRARPIPPGLRSRFSYGSVARFDDNGRRPGERPVPPQYGEETRPAPPAYGRERREPAGYEADSMSRRGMPPERMREETRPLPPAYGRERRDPPGYEADNMPGRGMPQGRMREEMRQPEPAYGNQRREPSGYEIDSAPRRGMPQERMRDEDSRQAPRFDRNDGRMRQDEDVPAVRGPDRNDRRLAPQGRDREQSAGAERQRGGDAADGNERSADSAPARGNDRGRGRMRDQDADSSDQRDGNSGRGNRRGD
jgi:hypothetical protein